MSKIENYNRLKKISDECNRIITKSKDGGLVHYTRQEDVYHIVAFSFITEGFNSHNYEKSKELADYIGESCKEFKSKIMERVLEIASQKADEARKAAKEEAESVLQEVSA
jgi:hypothetical protein